VKWGYEVALDQCTNGEPIDAVGALSVPAGGRRPPLAAAERDEEGVSVSGATLLAMARGEFAEYGASLPKRRRCCAS